MNKFIFSLILLLTASFGVFAQDIDNTPDPVASLRDQIQAASTASDRNRLQLELAELLISTGHRTEALKELQLIANSDSFDPVGFYNLGNAFARIGETGAAIDAYRTAIEQRKGGYSRAYNNLGVLLLRSGRWDEAHDALLSALKLENFSYAEASYNLGRVYAARGQRDLAAREWRRALYVNPQHNAAAQALANVGAEEKIVVESQPAKPGPPKAAPKPARVAPAAESVRKPLSLDQASFDFLQRARTAAERGKMTEAADNFIRLLNRQGGYFPPANLELSYALISLKRYDEAIGNLLKVSQQDGARYPISYFHLARLYESRGELKLAEAAFSQAATAYNPTNPQFLLDVTRVREKLGDYKGALESLERYLKLMPERGEKPVGSDERLAELRRKAGQ
jgi:tetratricopeptide (TPR) repeat protein